MNNKGFTLIELLAVFVVLGLILGFIFVSVSGIYKNAKNKAEEAFVSTIKDAMEFYLSSDARKLNDFEEFGCSLSKSTGARTVKVYKKEVKFDDVIKSGILVQSDLVNPANEEVTCNDASNIKVNIYKDEDFVYYYSVNVESFTCLTENITEINNLPEGFDCE